MLRRLRVRGFKSFDSETVLELSGGVNVIVGPNGSGKSNLAEAVIWALGEQRSGRLRAGVMGDVIHAGAARQAAFAEVALTVDRPAAEGGGPAEIEVARRLTRAGDADYLLNGDVCRLVDVQDVLAGRGLGPEALAIVRQGQVEALCASRPEERRAMIEEAAGVATAKRRRRRAELKLARTADKLDRARDLAGELASQARRLSRQAGAAERAADLERELTRHRALLHRARVEAAEREHADAVERREAAAAQVAAAAERRGAAAEDLRAAETSWGRAGETARAADEATLRLRAEAERVAGRAELARERVDEAARRAVRAAQERESASARMVALDAELENARGALVAGREGLESAERAARAEEEEARAARERLTAVRDRAAAATAAATALESEAVALQERREALDAQIERAARRRAELDGEAREERAGRAERRLEVATERRARWSERAVRLEALARDAEAQALAADEVRREADARARALAPLGGEEAGGAGTLGEDVVVEEGLERAVAAALGGAAEAHLTERIDEAVRALDAGASAALVPAPPRSPGSAPPGATPLATAVRHCPAGVRAHLDRLLANAWLVGSLADVPPGHAGVFVTREGVAYRPGDGIVAATGGAWARRSLRTRAETAAERARVEAEQVAAQAVGRRAERDAVAARQRAAERSAATAERALSAERAATAARAAELERARAAEESALADRGAIEARQGEIEGARPGRREAAAVEAREAEEARTAADAAEGRWRSAQTAAADRRAELAGEQARVAELESRRSAAATLAGEEGAGEGFDPGAAEAAVRALEVAAAALAPVAARAGARALELTSAAQEGERAVIAAREGLELAAAALSQVDAARQEAELALAVAAERRAEAARVGAAEGLDRPGAAADSEDDEVDLDPERLAERLQELERRREAIGIVNPLAAEERAELDERRADITTQVDDLEAACAALTAHLGELDEAVARGFDEVYEAVRTRFEEVASTLFPGGSGRLRAVETEGGEPGIEIEVVPAGKRPRSLELLSGGERSLVALAFCIALAMARPAPFYLLDEVEAALDDVNLRRLLGMLRRLAGETQFILITHQQPTVEIADTLFGVTMDQHGVSQVVARRLDQSVEGPAKPYVRRRLRAVQGGLG